jgi:hypothetical protein
MDDVKIIYECVFQKTWNNQVEFEMILDKVTDKRLVIGLLSDMAIRPKQYDVNRDIAIEFSSRFLNERDIKNIEYIRESNSYYRSIMKDYNNKELERHSFINNSLAMIKDIFDSKEKSEVFELFLSKQENKEYLIELKNILLEGELYEVISLIDKHI